jgi:hypothetical protein
MNGELLNAAEAEGIDLLVTGDKTVQFEQNMKRRSIAVVSLTAPKPGSFTKVDCEKLSRKRQRPEEPIGLI